MEKIRKRPKTAEFLLISGLCALLLIFSRTAAAGVASGLRISALSVVPALLPMSVVSGMAVRTGAFEAPARRLGGVFGRLFKAPVAGAVAFVLGLLGGYPIGAAVVGELRRRGGIGKADAEKLLCFCSNCGPGFIFGVAAPVVGTGNGFGAAVFLMLVHAVSAVLAGVLFSRLLKDGQTRPGGKRIPDAPRTLSAAFGESVAASALSMLRLTAYIAVFAAAAALLEEKTAVFSLFAPGGTGQAVFRGLLEMSAGVLALPPGPGSLPAASFILGFGGLCVAAQTAGIAGEQKIGIRYYIFAKFFQGTAAFLMSFAILRLFPGIV